MSDKVTSGAYEPWIETVSGVQFTFLRPRPELIVFDDIAYPLAKTCRYNGHTKRDSFYSVAEHSVLIAQAAYDAGHTDKQELMTALLHDAAEPYLADVARPVKAHLQGYKVMEANIEWAIACKFNLIHPLPDWLKELDTRILVDERSYLMSETGNPWETDVLEPLGVRPVGLEWKDAHRAFVIAFNDIENGRRPSLDPVLISLAS